MWRLLLVVVGIIVGGGGPFRVEAKGNKSDQAKMGGKSIAEKAVKAGIESVRFDRNGYLYHGRVKSLAEGAREAGLKF